MNITVHKLAEFAKFLFGHPGLWGFPGGSAVENCLPVQKTGSIPGSGRSPGEGNGYTLQYSCLENSMDREARWATVYGVTKSQTLLSN